jgi:hypothetical protein
MHKGGDELPETAGIDEINVEFAVVDPASSATVKPPP